MAHPTSSHERQDRALNVMGVVTLAVVVLVLGVAVVTIWRVFDQGASIAAQTRGDQISACRTEWAIVYDEADAALDDAESRRDDLVAIALRAAVLEDGPTLTDAVERSDAALAEVDHARVIRDRAIADRTAAASLSRTDPDELLRRCEDRFG